MQTFQQKLLTRCVIAAYGLLSASVMASESQFVADPTAGAQFQPSFSTSANQGIQVINIVAPSAAGISHNKFDTFNVGEEGVIHNNSTTGNETSVLDGGSIGANINFSGQSASTIIDEVTTSNTSSIEGAIEVYGDSAGLIIANPNGISCNGCSFINAPNSALTTGAVSYDQAGNIQFDTSGNANAVSIGSGGLDANGNLGTNNSNFSVISRQILLDGAVEGSDRVDIISGSNVYDFTQGSQDANGPNGSITKKAGTGSVNGLQIDASNVSSVQAGKINIVGTESGVGVQLNGSLDATAGNIEIDSDGNLVIGGSVSASESVRATTGNSADITNQGSITGRIAVEIDSDGAFDNSATGSITGTSVTIEADQNVTNTGSIQSTSRTASFVATNETDRVAEVAVGLADAIAQMAGVTSVRASDGLILIEVSDAVASDPNFPLVAEVELPDGTVKQFPLTKDGGAYTIDLRQTVAESGLPSDNTAFSPVAGAQYRLRSTGDLSVAARSLNNSGTLSSEGDVDVAVNASITNSGRIASGVDINLSANSVTNSGEQGIVAGQDINIDLDGYQTSLTNEGLIGAGRDLQIGTDGDRIYSVTNRGNRALLAAGRDATVFSDTIENTGQAAIYSGGDLGLTASQSIRNLDGSLIEGRNVNLTTTAPFLRGEIENSESTIYSVNDTTITTDTLRNWRGSGFVTQRSTSGSGWTEQQGLRRHAWGSEEYAYFTRELSSENYDASREAAALLSGGDLTVSAYLVLNEASTIQSSGDITITADEIDNRTLSTTTVRDSERRRFYNGSNNISISNLSDQYQTCLAGQTDCINDSTLQNLRGETTYYTNADGSLYGEARILSNGNVTINTQSGIRSDGRIQGSNVSLDGGAGGVQNGADSGSVVRFERQSTGQVDTSVSERAVGQEVRQAAGLISDSALSGVGGSRSASVPTLADIEAISPPGFQLTGLYSVTTDPNSRYLVQSRVSPGIGGLSQDYLLAQLQQTDAENVTFFADPFVEQRIVRNQLLQQTGSTVAIDEADDETDQLRRLYDNAATFANQTEGVELGQALTETQIASLDQPIVWYENQVVDGRTVLVPRVYVPTVDALDLSPAGQIVASNNLNITTEGDVTNTGGVRAGNTVSIDAENILNETLTTVGVTQTGSGNVLYRTAGPTASIEGGSVELNISSAGEDEGNLVNRGAAIRATAEDGSLEINTSGDLINEALVVQQVSDVEIGNLGRLAGKQDFTVHADFVGATIESANNLSIDTEGEVVNIASDLAATNDVLIDAREGFYQQNLADIYTVEDSVNLGGSSSSSSYARASASGDSFGSFEANAEAGAEGSQDLISGQFRQGFTNQSATVRGGNVRIVSAEGDITSVGSDITSTGETVLEATEGDINLIADAIITESSSFALSAGGSASASAGGSGLSYRADAAAEGGLSLSGQSQQTANFVNSTVTGNNITLRAQNVRGVGAEVAAENNINVDVAEDVTFTAAQARVENSSFSVGVSQEVYAGAGTAEGGLGTPDGEVGTRTNFGLDVTSGFNTSTSSSGLRAGGNLNINAGGDASFIGTDLEAGQDITLDAGGDVTIAAIAEESSQTSVGISGSIGAELNGSGAIPTGSLEAGGSTTDATRFLESRTTASGNLTIRSGGDAELVGVNLTAGGDASIEAEDVRIASAQDIVETRGGSVGLAVVNPGDILNTDESPLSVGVELSDSRAVAERSQVNTGGNLSVNARSGDAIIAGVDGNVEGNVSLTAANGESGFQELRDEVNTTSVGVDLSVSSALGSTGGGLAGIAEGTIEAIESGDGYALLNQIPGVQQVATLAAGIESGDVTQIVAGITPIGGQLLTAIDQSALGGQISANSRAQGGTEGTGAQAFLQNLQSSGNNSPAVTPLGNIVEGSSVGDIAAGADIVELDTGIDARLGVEVTTTQSDTSNGNNLQIGGNLVQEGQTVSQIGSDINVDGDATLRGGQVAIEAGVDRFSSQTTTAGVTVGFDVANQDVKVGVDGSYSTEDETTVNNSSLTAGGNLTIEASDARVASANVEAENITVDAENLEVVTLQSTRDTLSYGGAVEVEVGITGDSGAGAVEANGSETSSRTTGEQASLIARNNLDVDVDERLTLRSAQLGAEGTTTITADVIDARANTDTNDSFGFDVAVEVSANQQGEGQSGGSGSVDFSFEQSNQRGPAALSGIFGDNVDINARDVLLEDTQVNGNTVALDVEEDLTIRTTATQASNVGIDFEVSAGGQSSGSEGGARGGASLGFGLDVGDSTTFGQQAGINAGNLTLNTGGDVALNNAEINANDAAIAIGGDLTVASQQSTSNSVTVDLDLDPAANAQAASSAVTAGADLGVGFSSENSAQVDRPSGIQIANTLDLTVGSDVALTAAEISGDAVNATIGGDVTTVSVSNSSNLIVANVGTSGVGFENESSQSVTTSGITARSGQLNVTTNVAAVTVAQSGDQVIETVPGTSLAQNESGVVSQTAQTSTQTEVEAAPTVDSQVALANSRAGGLIRLISQAPPAVRQNAVRQIAEQLAQSPDLTNAAMLDGLNPTQKIEVLESALDVASDNDREVIEQAIELLRVDELILGANI